MFGLGKKQNTLDSDVAKQYVADIKSKVDSKAMQSTGRSADIVYANLNSLSSDEIVDLQNYAYQQGIELRG